MRLGRLRVANFRGIPDFELDVNGSLVLVGPNDSGKSSVLLGLNALLGIPGSHLGGVFTTEDFTELSQDLEIEAWLTDIEDDDRAAFPDEIAIVDGRERLRIRLAASIDPADPEIVRVERDFPDSGLGRSMNTEQLRVIGWEYIPAGRSLYRELGSAKSGVVRSLLAGVNLGDDADRLELAVQGLAEALGEVRSLDGFKEQLAAALSTTLPRAITKDEVEVRLAGDLSADPLSGAELGLADGDRSRSLNEQSDGVRALTVLAAYSVAHTGASIVAIDEPEMHLHPTAQSAIARVLGTSAAQVVLATHSSRVASQFPPSQIARIDKGTGVAQLAPGADATEYFFAARWWQDQLIQPLTARCVVAVEGPSERMLLDAVDAQLGLNLHQSGVHVLDLGGADLFKPAYKVFGPDGFGARVLGLVDEDHREAWADVLGVRASDLEREGCWVCDPDLEGEVVQALGPSRVIELLDASGLFSEAIILAALGKATVGDVAHEDLAQYLGRKKVKTRAAAALARVLEAADAAALTKLVGVLKASIE